MNINWRKTRQATIGLGRSAVAIAAVFYATTLPEGDQIQKYAQNITYGFAFIQALVSLLLFMPDKYLKEAIKKADAEDKWTCPVWLSHTLNTISFSILLIHGWWWCLAACCVYWMIEHRIHTCRRTLVWDILQGKED